MASAIIVATDLMMTSRVAGAARDMGVEVKSVRDASALCGELDRTGVTLVMVDMNLPPTVTSEAIRIAASHASKPQTIAFYSHVQTELREAAVQAGADQVLPRSKFVEVLPSLLERFCK